MKPSSSTSMNTPYQYSFTGTSNQYVTDQHKHLHDILNHLPYQRQGHFTSSSHATLIRQLFSTVWQRDFIKYWDVGRGDYPSGKELGEWVGKDEFGLDISWNLYETQKRRLQKEGIVRAPKKGRRCGKVLQRYERTFICKTCLIDPSCLLCVDCFKASDHQDHEVLFGQSFSFGAVCDCGDPSAWRDHVGCRHHPPAESEQPPAPPGFTTDNPVIPPSLIQAIQATIVQCIEFVICTLQHSPLTSEFPVIPETDAEMSSGSNVSTGEPVERRGRGPWSVVVWSDEKHVLKEMTRQIRDTLGMTWEESEVLAKQTDEIGRRIMVTSANPVIAFHTASMFHQIDAGVTLRSAMDVFREEMVGIIINWLMDMCKSTSMGDDTIFRRILWQVLNSPRTTIGNTIGTTLLKDLRIIPYGAKRADWLMRLDSRLWKRAKWELRQIYSYINCLDSNISTELLSRLSFNYTRMFDLYLFHERDPDTSLIYTVTMCDGKVAAQAVMKGQLLVNILDTAEAWYTGEFDDYRLIVPLPDQQARLDIETSAFRGKKGTIAFVHLRALFRFEEVQKLVLTQPALFNRALAFFNVFVGMQTQRREQGEHIEYEVEWQKCFVVLGELGKCSREFGEMAKWGTTEQIMSALAVIANRTLCDMMLMSPTLDPSRYHRPGEWQAKGVLIPESLFNLIQVNVAQIDAFSFHHYLTWIFAEMCKWIPNSWKGGNFIEMFERMVLRAPSPADAERMKLLLIEYPLQKHVVLSQIRADMWKKNGSAMRGQLHHYRDGGNRESTIDQEFFLLQVGLCIIDPAKFMVALIDRFGLVDFFSLDVMSPNVWFNEDADPKTLISLMEDLVLLVIQLVSDTAIMTGWDQARLTRRNLIHILALNSLQYSEIIKKLTERGVERSILPFLKEVANFKEPTETNVGSYSLKSEFLDEVDPYWRHYTRNDQRIIIGKITQRAETPFVKPKPLNLPTGPYAALGSFLETPVVANLVYWVLAHCMPMADLTQWPGLQAAKNEAPQLETLLDLGLHLAMIAQSVAPKAFAEASVEILDQSNSMSTFQNLWYMQTSDHFKQFRPKVDTILESIVENLPEHYTTDYKAQRETENFMVLSPQPKVDHKAAANARQKAIMAEFAKKQASFAAFMDEGDEEEEEEEESGSIQGLCIVCQGSVTPSAPGGLLGLIQPSRFVREAVADRDWFEEHLQVPYSLDDGTRVDKDGPESTNGYPATHLRFGVHVSACSHMMHEACVSKYFDVTQLRQATQVARHHPENAVRMEFLCPLCKSLGNCLIPLDESPVALQRGFGKLATLTEKIRGVSEEGLIRVTDSTKIWDHHVETGELQPWFTDTNFHQQSLDHDYRRTQRPVGKMLERMRGLLRPLSEQSQRLRGKKNQMYLPDDVVAYTVACCEIAQRGMKKVGLSVAEQVPENALRGIKRLIGMLQLELDFYFGVKYDRTTLRVGIFARFLPDWYRASSLPSPLLLRSQLAVVVETAALAPDLIQPVIVMSYYAELTRCMLGLAIYIKRCLKQPSVSKVKGEGLELFTGFKGIMLGVLRNAGPFTDIEGILGLLTDDMLAKLLYSHTLPYLRRCAIIYYAASGTYPVTLAEEPTGCEYIRLLNLLGISRPRETLSRPQSTESNMVGRWLAQWALQGRIVPQTEFPGIYELYKLPPSWEDVVLAYVERRCERCKSKPSFPAVCLYCGKFVCLAGDCCAEGESGECNLHMRECGAVTGLFVDIKRWTILYLFAGSGSFGHMPYLDTHGELDISMRRGNRQYVHVGRMDELRKERWLQHGIPHFAARKLEVSNDGGGWGCM